MHFKEAAYADKLNHITLVILTLTFYDLQKLGGICMMTKSEFLMKGKASTLLGFSGIMLYYIQMG